MGPCIFLISFYFSGAGRPGTYVFLTFVVFLVPAGLEMAGPWTLAKSFSTRLSHDVGFVLWLLWESFKLLGIPQEPTEDGPKGPLGGLRMS